MKKEKNRDQWKEKNIKHKTFQWVESSHSDEKEHMYLDGLIAQIFLSKKVKKCVQK